MEFFVHHGRLILSLSLVTAVGLAGCKPRAADSALRANEGTTKSSTVAIEREVVSNLAVEDTDGQKRASRFAEWAKYWASPNVTTDKVETPPATHVTAANQVAIKLHATAGAHIGWLKTARAAKAEDRKTGSVSVDSENVDAVIATYEGIQSLMRPMTEAKAWANWTSELGLSASKRFSDAAAAFGMTIDEVATWKPTDDDLAVDALEAAKANGPEKGNAAPPEAIGAKASPDDKPVATPQTAAGKPTPKVTPKPPPPPQKSAQQLAYEAAEKARLDWLKFVQTAERRIVDGDFTGKMPTLDDMQGAVDEAERHPGRRCNDGLSDYNSICRGQPIIDALSRVEEIKGLFSDSAGVSEGYSVRQHTERVLAVYLEQRKLYGYPQSDKRYKLMMPIVVALHDIGKPVAARTTGTQAQHEHNQAIVKAMLRHLGFVESEVLVGSTMVSGDLLGWIVKGNRSTFEAVNGLSDFAALAGISKKEYFHLLRTEYIADAASYPTIRQQAFYSDQAGRLLTRNGSLERIYTALNPPPTPPPAPKPEVKIPPKPMPTQQEVVKGEINSGDLGPAGEKAALAHVDKATGAKTPDQQAAAGVEPTEQGHGVQPGKTAQQGQQTQQSQATATQQGAQPTEEETKTTRPDAKAQPTQPAQPVQPQPWFVGKKFTGSRIVDGRLAEMSFVFLANGACQYYPSRNTNPDWFVQSKWVATGGQNLSVTYPTAAGGSASLTLVVRSAREMTVWIGQSGFSVTSP